MRALAVIVLTVSVGRALADAPDAPAPAPVAPVAPDAPVDPAAQVDELFSAGRALLADHHAAEACDKFAAAIKLDPDAAGVMLNLGLCHRDLDELATALRWFRKAQARGSENGLAEIEAVAKEQTGALAARVPTASFTLSPAPSPTAPAPTITIDGDKLADTDVARVELDAGHHVVVVANDRGTSRREIVVSDGENATFALAVPHSDPGAAGSAIDRGARQRHRARAVAEISGGVLGGILVAGLVAHHVAADPATSVDTQARLQSTFEWGVTPLAIAGFAGVAYAAWLWKTAPTEHPLVVPVITPTQVGVALSASF